MTATIPDGWTVTEHGWIHDETGKVRMHRSVLENPRPPRTRRVGDSFHLDGDHLRRQRRAAGMTQAELAGRVGVTERTIRAWERGAGVRDHFRRTRQLAEILGGDRSDYFGGRSAAAGS